MRIVCFERLERAGDDASRLRSATGVDLEEPVGRGSHRLGALVDTGPDAGAVVDLNLALALDRALGDAPAPEAEADSLIPADPIAFLERGALSLEAARTALEFAKRSLDRYDAPDLRAAGIVSARRDVRLHAPIPRPGKLIGVARNYPAHARERGDPASPEEPVLFIKASSAVIGPNDDIVVPRAVTQPDYEGELGVVIGRRAESVPVEEALSRVAGYCVANDVSARDFQGQRGQRFLGKSCDTFAPLGPAIVTTDEVPDPRDLSLVTRLSGEVVQQARTKEMHFGVEEIIAFASRLMRLDPGDVILTGTPSGVGAARDPARWLRDGDVVEVEIERIGRLVNYVRRSA